MRPRSRWLGGFAVLIVVGLLIAALRGRALPPATPHAWAPPSVPAEGRLAVCWIEFGRHRTLAGFSRAGWSQSAAWDVTVSGLLLRHPGGDVLLDAGNSSHFARSPPSVSRSSGCTPS